MTFTVTLLPSASDTHGSHSPKVTTPFLSIALRSPRGRRSVIALPMDEPRSTDEQKPKLVLREWYGGPHSMRGESDWAVHLDVFPNRAKRSRHSVSRD